VLLHSAGDANLLSIDTSGKACCWEVASGRCKGQASLGFAPGRVSLVLPGDHVALERRPPPEGGPTACVSDLVLLDTASMTVIAILEGGKLHQVASSNQGAHRFAIPHYAETIVLQSLRYSA